MIYIKSFSHHEQGCQMTQKTRIKTTSCTEKCFENKQDLRATLNFLEMPSKPGQQSAILRQSNKVSDFRSIRREWLITQSITLGKNIKSVNISAIIGAFSLEVTKSHCLEAILQWHWGFIARTMIFGDISLICQEWLITQSITVGKISKSVNTVSLPSLGFLSWDDNIRYFRDQLLHTILEYRILVLMISTLFAKSGCSQSLVAKASELGIRENH